MINQKVYEHKGVDVVRNVLQLKRVANADSLYSTQIGFKAHPFTASEFATRKKISLGDYRGKYVFIDFWGTWCAPCRAEMPFLKGAYATTKRDKIEFIGIVSEDTPEKLKAYVDKEV